MTAFAKADDEKVSVGDLIDSAREIVRGGDNEDNEDNEGIVGISQVLDGHSICHCCGGKPSAEWYSTRVQV